MLAVELPNDKQQQEKGTPLVSENSEALKSYQDIPKNDVDSSPFEFSEAKQGGASDIKKGSEYNLKKMTIIISLIIFLVGVASFLAIYFTMDHSNIQIQLVRDGSGEIHGQSVSYQQHSVMVTFKDNTQEEMSLFSVSQKNVPTGRFLSDGTTQETSDVTCYYANAPSTSDTVRLCNQADPTDPQVFQYDTLMDGANFIQQAQDSEESDQKTRFLEEESTSSDNRGVADKINSIIDDLKSEQGITLSFHLEEDPLDITNHQTNFYGNDGPVISQKAENLTNPYSETTSTEEQNNGSTSSNSMRMLRFGWVGKITNKVVQNIQKSAPVILQTVGASVGATTALPIGSGAALVGAVQGGKLGSTVGQTISTGATVAKSCVPKLSWIKSIQFKCSSSSIASIPLASLGTSVFKRPPLIAKVASFMKKRFW